MLYIKFFTTLNTNKLYYLKCRKKHSPYPLPVVSYNFIARELRIRCP